MKEKDLYFSFEFVDKPKISKEINKLDGKKTCQGHDIPVKLIKSNKDLFSHFIYHNFNNSLFSSNFPSNLLTDLSKVLDCIKHDLLRAKLAAYGFDSHFIKFCFHQLS